MPGIYDEVDVRWSWNGDYDIDQGDLADTSSDTLLSLRQEIMSVVNSEIGDWENNVNHAAQTSDFIGLPNTKETADAIHDRVRLSIISNGLVLEEDLDVRVIPVHRHKVLVLITVSATPTAYNSLDDNRLVVALVFDFLEQGVFFLDKIPDMGVS